MIQEVCFRQVEGRLSGRVEMEESCPIKHNRTSHGSSVIKLTKQPPQIKILD